MPIAWAGNLLAQLSYVVAGLDFGELSRAALPACAAKALRRGGPPPVPDKRIPGKHYYNLRFVRKFIIYKLSPLQIKLEELEGYNSS